MSATTSTKPAAIQRSPRRRPRVSSCNSIFQHNSRLTPLPADAAKASSEIKSHLPGSGKEAKKEAEAYGQEAQSKLNQLGRDIKAEANKAEASLEKTSKDVAANANKAIDQFDKKVSEVSDKLFCAPGRDGHRWAGGEDNA